MSNSEAVHHCLFCQQTFNSAADKDDHVLDHFARETCAECNENLIRIGGYLYMRHNKATCIKKTAISEENVESCTSTEPIQTTPESHTLARNVHSSDTAHTPQIKTEPKDFDESMSAPVGSEMMSSIFVDGLSIQRRFLNVNLNPVVVLEDILKKTDTVRPPMAKRCKTETEPNLESARHSKIQNHKCHTCSINFKRREYLVDHMTIHTGAKPYLCTYEHCKQRFRTRSHKYQHIINKHSKVKTSVCGVNGREKTFSTEESLELHIDKEHDTPTTNYSCYICSEVFNVKANLVEHIKKKHETLEIHNTEHSIEQVEPQLEQSAFSNQEEEHNLNGVELQIEEEELLIELESNGQPSQQDSNREYDDRDETFQTRNLNNYKEVSHDDDNGEFKCGICNEKFTMRRYLSAHINRAHNPNTKNPKDCLPNDASTHGNVGSNLKCRYKGCELRFKNQQDRILHMKEHHNEKHICSIDGCGKQFMFRSVLKLHQMREHSSEKLYNCAYDYCKERFKTHAQKSQHIINVHSQENLCPCNVDDYEKLLSSSQSLEFHRANEPFKSTYSCDTEEQSVEHTQLEQEQSIIIASHHEEDNRNGEKFEIKEEQLLIELVANKQPSQQDDSREWDNTIPAQNEDVHNKIPNRDNNGKFICKICKKNFLTHTSFRTHFRLKHGPHSKTFICGICGITCAHGRELHMHIESVHSNIRKHKCNTCGKLFKNGEHLKVHERIHTGEKPFQCSFENCGKRFITQFKKVQHERVHTGEKPYVCEFHGCGKAFGANRYLKTHRSKVHGISLLSYSCGVCSRLFKIKAKLMRHIQEEHRTMVVHTPAQQQQTHDSNHQECILE